ncbi:hypothetical protein ACFQRC_03735 [Enterovirga sp. GCM10030262]|uniref:hypothetical protein n=1 Tax=Enterovirga sp. GCM10030262 TaxID=3273391 RepID=UPI00361EA385
MLYHLSIEADDPGHVADVFAEIWGGVALPFPSVIDGSWVALAGDERGTMIEVYPRGTELHEIEGDADAIGLPGRPRRNNATHMAMATHLDVQAIFRIARREGWIAKYRKRGGVFGVIEMWIEDCQMVEILTPEMQREYQKAITVENWRRMLAARAALVPAAA